MKGMTDGDMIRQPTLDDPRLSNPGVRQQFDGLNSARILLLSTALAEIEQLQVNVTENKQENCGTIRQKRENNRHCGQAIQRDKVE